MLKSENKQQRLEKLKKIPFIQQFDEAYIDQVYQAAELREYEPDDVLIEEGAMDRAIYILLVGEVKVMKADEEITRIDQYGEIFGELAVVNNEVRSASIAAVSATYCLVIDTDFMDDMDLHARTACYSIIYRHCADILSRRLKACNEEMVKLKKEITRLRALTG